MGMNSSKTNKIIKYRYDKSISYLFNVELLILIKAYINY